MIDIEQKRQELAARLGFELVPPVKEATEPAQVWHCDACNRDYNARLLIGLARYFCLSCNNWCTHIGHDIIIKK